MRTARLDELQAGSRLPGEISTTSDMWMIPTTLMEESEEELKNLLMRVKEESDKVSLKLNIKKTKIMASGPITSWKIDGEKVEAVRDFLFLGSKISADGDCSHEIERCLLSGRKDNKPRQCIKKLRRHFADKDPYSQSNGVTNSHVQM